MLRSSGSAIKKLQWGVITGEPSQVIQVGSSLRFKNKKGEFENYRISEIIENKDAFVEFGYFEYEVYICKEGSQELLFWQRYIKPPDKIEYNISDSEEFFV